MKVEQLIVQYLYNTKKLTLQDIGSFTIAPEIYIPAENEKETELPPNAVVFEYDPKAKQDDALVDFIIQQTRKIRPLATSDLESYSILSRQFLNIGKPLRIEGLGTLLKTQAGGYEFAQGHMANPRLVSLSAPMREKVQEDVDFSSPAKPKNNSKGWVWLFIILVVAGGGVAAYMYLHNRHEDTGLERINPADTAAAAVNALPKDTTHRDSVPPLIRDTTSAPAADYNFRVVIKEYSNSQAAQKTINMLTNAGHTVLLIPVDSSHYKLAIPFKSSLADTLHAKDSLGRFFQFKAYIELP